MKTVFTPQEGVKMNSELDLPSTEKVEFYIYNSHNFALNIFVLALKNAVRYSHCSSNSSKTFKINLLDFFNHLVSWIRARLAIKKLNFRPMLQILNC
ncbi:hypothetical protein [uncultured Polaribacter sp.]|uniref:hypothetical protein n=1 Tax=uncultured Polaribacter sp. TaxID=174711 RepID=UPI0026353CE0|nr:hypothetical protein [uncultured Polaribacter sp.]